MERKSNIELCRLASILLVMLVHTTSKSLGLDMSYGTRLLEGFSIIGVNVFVLITGYFSATPKKTSLINLAFICLFWGVIKIICLPLCNEPVIWKDLFFITTSNWFIPCYIGLLFFTPILNTFCNTVTKQQLWSVVITLLMFELWFDWMPPFPDMKIGANNGYSVLSFSILYLLARAIRLYGLPQWFKRSTTLVYIGCSIALGTIAHIGAKVGLGYQVHGPCFSYHNPLVLVSSVAFLMMFEQMHIQSKIINHLAKSTLAVLLGHSTIMFLYTKQFKYLFDNFSGILQVGYWAFAIVLVFCSCILVDQLRIILYVPIAKLLKKRIKKNEIF